MRKIFILIPILLSTACAGVKVKSVDNMLHLTDNISINISAVDSIISTSLIIKCHIYNGNNCDVAILNRQDYTFINDFMFVWFATITKDDEKMMLPFDFIEVVVPTSKSYLTIAPGESIDFKFEVDFENLEKMREDYIMPYKTSKNTNYGKYFISFNYKDSFLKHRNALTNIIKSDTISVIYNPR